MSLLQISVSGGMMVIIITIIRVLAINHLPKRTFLVMWGIVLTRLLLPFSFPSPLSVYSLVNLTSMGEKMTFAPTVNFLPIVTIFPSGRSTTTSMESAVNFSSWGVVWLIGVILCGLYYILAYIKCCHAFNACRIVENDYIKSWLKDNKLKRTITIRQTAHISAPLTYGIFNPVILMPKNTDWTDSKKIQYVLAHEFMHIKHFDIVAKILFTAAVCVHWFNPFVWIMYNFSNRDMELACDEAVLRSFGESIKSAYALTLINMEEQKRQGVAFCNNFSKNAIEERIKAIMKTKRTTKFSAGISLIAILFVVIPFATNAQALARPMDSSVVSKSNLRKVNVVDSLPTSSGGRAESTRIQFVSEQPEVIAYTPDASGKIVVPVSVQSLDVDSAICVGEIPNIADMSELKYDVHAPEGAGNLYVAMHKPNDDTGLWFNQVGMFGEGKTGRDIVWKMDGNSDENFGYDEGYAGNYMVCIISENGNLSDIGGSITITYNSSKRQSAQQIDANPSQSLTVLVDISSVNSGDYIWLGEYSLVLGDKITYDVSAKTGSGFEIGFAALNDDPSNRTYYTVSNTTLSVDATRNFSDQTKPGQYKLFIQAIGGETLEGVSGTVTIGK